MRSILAGLAAALSLAAPAIAAPDVSRMTGGELAAFTRAMPKGGELHNHISGALFAETELAWAVEDGLCVDVKALAIMPSCQPSETVKTAAAVAADPELRSALVDSLSVRRPGFRGRTTHDQFFGVFGRGYITPARAADALASVMDGLGRQNTFYLEAMFTPPHTSIRPLAASVGWMPDLPAMKAALSAGGLEALAPGAIAETDALEARIRALLKCGTPAASPGCQVTVRYLLQAGRTGPLEVTFAQLQLGVALAARDRRWVGIQLVAPEDDPVALASYGLHMKMVDFLTDHGRRTPVSLHAGEVTLKLAPPEDLRDHVAQAVRTTGARRIGHGADIAQEADAEVLAAEMSAKGILVEVNLTSNAEILEIAGKAHPYAWLRQRGVPVSLSTDDAGILRIELSGEYARAAQEGATYADLKASARNAIAFSFLAGEGLWGDPGIYRQPAAACGGQIGQAEPKGACAALVAASDKAREQWRHEHLLSLFETAHP